MKHSFLFLLALMLALVPACRPTEEQPDPENPQDSLPAFADPDDSLFSLVSLHATRTYVQPLTGLVLWPDLARSRNTAYGNSIALEFNYCLPCRVVTGKVDGQLQYDWTYLERILDDIASRGHQAIIRFRYEYPSSKDVDGQRGTTAVPDYIKALPDYEETYSADPGGDGPTYYADWRHPELQWFTLQFYTDLAARYGSDPRIAFVEVGFGHWSEYHIYGTPLRLGVNFPSKEFQAEFFRHMAEVMPLPWLVSIDAADGSYSPVVSDPSLMALTFGLFDDSFMHKGHEIGSADGYNERNWNAIGKGIRWQTGVCGGEVSYYTSKDQKEFLNPDGLYGHTWEEQAAKYHITFMIGNDAPSGTYGTAERFLSAGLHSGYCFRVVSAKTSDKLTRLRVINEGVAPIYYDAFFAVGDTRSSVSLRGLLPGDTLLVEIPAKLTDPSLLHILSDHTLPSRPIQFEADLN